MTCTFLEASSTANCRVIMSTAPLLAQYALLPPSPARAPRMDETLMIFPPPLSTMCAPKCLQHIMTPRTFTPNSLSHSSMGNSVAGALALYPWALTRISTRPMSETELATNSWTLLSSVAVDRVGLDLPARARLDLLGRLLELGRVDGWRWPPGRRNATSPSAIPWPKPPAPPTTTAFLPLSENRSSIARLPSSPTIS